MSQLTVQTKWYEYRQNNSGGHFRIDEKIAKWVIIEAIDERHALSRAEEIGLYFDGSGDCPCCGYRWSTMADVADVPSQYSTPLVELLSEEYQKKAESWQRFDHPDDSIRIHALSGDILAIDVEIDSSGDNDIARIVYSINGKRVERDQPNPLLKSAPPLLEAGE